MVASLIVASIIMQVDADETRICLPLLLFCFHFCQLWEMVGVWGPGIGVDRRSEVFP